MRSYFRILIQQNKIKIYNYSYLFKNIIQTHNNKGSGILVSISIKKERRDF